MTVSILKPEPQIYNLVVIFSYPFYLINKTDVDMLLRYKESQKLQILKQNELVSSRYLIPGKCESGAAPYFFKPNENDYQWSRHIRLFFESGSLDEKQIYFKIYKEQNFTEFFNYVLTVQKCGFTTLVEIDQNMNEHVQILNQSKENVYAQQLNCGPNRELINVKQRFHFF